MGCCIERDEVWLQAQRLYTSLSFLSLLRLFCILPPTCRAVGYHTILLILSCPQNNLLFSVIIRSQPAGS